MAPKSHSTSSSAAGAMRASLVLVLLLAAVASAQAGRPVSCENKCGVPVLVNGVLAAIDATVVVIVDVDLKVQFKDKTGKEYTGSWACPADVTAIVLVKEGLFFKVKVKATVIIIGVVRTLLNAVLGSIQCIL